MGFEVCGGRSGAAASLVWVARLLPNLLKGIHFLRLGILLLTFIIIGMNDGLKGRKRVGETAGQTYDATIVLQ